MSTLYPPANGLVRVCRVYQPKPLSTPTGAPAAELGHQALQQRLTVYAGAGISAAPPTSLPGAAGLAERVYNAVSSEVSLDGVDPRDLVAVADRIEREPRGAALLKATILHVADLKQARFGYAHAVLALLLCEGAIVVIETNYDDCIERAATPERIPVVITDADRMSLDAAALLKAHGCATKPDTMLVTSAELNDPPLFARAELALRLGLGPVVFIGIGSPADYVRSSLRALIAKVSTATLMVIGPEMADWANSAWSGILGDLPQDQRIADTADAFADALLRGYLRPLLSDVVAKVQAMPVTHPQRAGVTSLLTAFDRKDGVTILRWLRSTGWRHGVGQPVANSGENVRGLLALGALSGGSDAEIRTGGILALSRVSDPMHQTAVLLLQSARAPLGSLAAAEARIRVADARGEGRVPTDADVVVVCVGHVGPLGEDEVPTRRGATLDDVLTIRAANAALDAAPGHLIDEPDAAHLLDSFNAGRVMLVTGDSLIEAA